MAAAAEVSETSYFVLFMCLRSCTCNVPMPIPSSYSFSPFKYDSFKIEFTDGILDNDKTFLVFKVCRMDRLIISLLLTIPDLI